jgi:hypothetical protein
MKSSLLSGGENMKITLEFNLPEDRKEYENCYKGQDYINAIRDIVEFIKRRMDDDDKDTYYPYERVYLEIFDICKEHGFSPWEE